MGLPNESLGREGSAFGENLVAQPVEMEAHRPLPQLRQVATGVTAVEGGFPQRLWQVEAWRSIKAVGQLGQDAAERAASSARHEQRIGGREDGPAVARVGEMA